VADHPLKVPQHLAERLWLESADKPPQCNTFRAHVFAQKIAQWAADQELDEVGKEIIKQGWVADPTHRCAQLRAARRPKPPSLKQQALKARENVRRFAGDNASWEILDRAIETLPDE
jgi:hypothetical protein